MAYVIHDEQDEVGGVMPLTHISLAQTQSPANRKDVARAHIHISHQSHLTFMYS